MCRKIRHKKNRKTKRYGSNCNGYVYVQPFDKNFQTHLTTKKVESRTNSQYAAKHGMLYIFVVNCHKK